MSKIYLVDTNTFNAALDEVNENVSKALSAGLWLYSANLTVDGWIEINSENPGQGYYQTVSCSVLEEKGEEITEDTQLAIPMAVPTGDWDTDDIIKSDLCVIADGVV